MFDKLRSSFLRKNDTNAYAYLPDKIQNEIKSANEATTVYDIP
ncbi:hypothetical protein [Demequina sp.]|nr:hypothetical protein [Demequina sp.]